MRALLGCSRGPVGHGSGKACGRRFTSGAAEKVSGERCVSSTYGGFHGGWRGSGSPCSFSRNQYGTGATEGDEHFCDASLDDVACRANHSRIVTAGGLCFQLAAVGAGELAEL